MAKRDIANEILKGIQEIKAYKTGQLSLRMFQRDPDQKLNRALKAVWDANTGVNEEEVMADALEAIRAFRMEQATHRT